MTQPHTEPVPTERDEEDEAYEAIERESARRRARGDDVEPIPDELQEQVDEALRDLDAEEPDALARHALEAAVGNDD